MSSHAPASRRTLIMAWLALVILSVITVTAGSFTNLMIPGLIVLAAGMAKAWVIVDHFMELHDGPRAWHIAMLAWPLTMAVAIGLAFAGRLPAG